MPRLALALVVIWALLLFVLRSILQWWRTGSTGIKGFSGAIGSVEWWAGVLASVGLVACIVAPLATLRGWRVGDLWIEAPILHFSGAAIAIGGIAGALVAQLTMGDSWRIGVDASERTSLVTRGLYQWVRNPIFSFMILSVLGLAMLVPSLLSAFALACTVMGIELQVRAVEEPHLLRAHGTPYESYCRRTGRFVPGLGKLPA